MVRYADGPTATVTTEVGAPVDVVWRLVSDPDLPARFSDEFQGGRWLDGATGPAVGARFEGRNRNEHIGTWTVVCTVTHAEPGRRFGWVVGDVAAPTATWRFDLEPIDSGTRLTQTAVMGPGPSGMTPFIERHPDREEELVEGRLASWRANMTATIEGIGALAEEAA